MKKGVKVLWITLGAVFLAGVILMMAGFFSGADLNIYRDDAGFHTANHHSENFKIDESDMEDFNEIRIDADYTDIKIIGRADADTGSLEIVSAGNPSYSVEDGVLKITKHESKKFYSLNLFGIGFEQKEEITVFCKSDEMLQTVNIDVAAGNIEVANIVAGSVTIQSEAGDITIEDVEMGEFTGELGAGEMEISDSQADNLTINNALGDVTLRNTTVRGESRIRLSAGDVEAHGDFGATRIDTALGNIEFNTVKDEDEYTCKFNVALGNISIDGYDFGGGRFERGNGPNELDIYADMGDIEVEFGSL